MALPVDVFVVQHLFVYEDGEEEVKLIGVYSTREAAQDAVKRLRLKPGFAILPKASRLTFTGWTKTVGQRVT